MINTYYILEDNEKTGPFTHDELMDMNIRSDTFILSPLDENWQHASDLAEFHSYFESRGVFIPTESNVANFWWRSLAYILDYIILIIVMMLIGAIWGMYNTLTRDSESGYYIPDTELFFRFLAILIFIAYNTLFESLTTQGSIGKVICKMVVVDAAGERLSPGKALTRNASKILSSLICGLGFFCVLWDKHRQGLHDNIAKTYVVRK